MKIWAPENTMTDHKLNVHEMLTTCHSGFSHDQIPVTGGGYMFLRSRSSFLTSVFKFDDLLIEYSYISRHFMTQGIKDWWKISMSLSSKVGLTPTRNIGCIYA